MLLSLLVAFSPADLAPGARELSAAEAHLQAMLRVARATRAATVRLQTAWTRQAAAKGDPCVDTARLELGWRIERFGAAWREAAQAARAAAADARRVRNAPTAAPLVEARWAASLEAAFAEADAIAASFVEASAWQATWVRPVLAACPIVPARPDPGQPGDPPTAAGEPAIPVAVLGLGDGWICPDRQRADESVVLLAGGEACWAPDVACSCEPQIALPGAVLAPGE
jgi:hypothetical protein